MNSISLNTLVANIQQSQSLAGVNTESSGSFADALQTQIEETNILQQQSAQAIKNVEDGDGSINDAMIAMQKASLSFQTTKTVMNKMVSAYQDIMNTQI